MDFLCVKCSFLQDYISFFITRFVLYYDQPQGYIRKSKDPTYFIQMGIRNGKKTTTKNVKRIGKHSELLTITDDPLAYAKKQVEDSVPKLGEPNA